MDCIDGKPICLMRISFLLTFLYVPNHIYIVLLYLLQDTWWTLAFLPFLKWIFFCKTFDILALFVKCSEFLFYLSHRSACRLQHCWFSNLFLWHEKPLLHSKNNKILKCHGKQSLICTLCQVSKIFLDVKWGKNRNPFQ